MNNELLVWPFRFRFRALDAIVFPAGKAGNVLRGAFGTVFRKLACAPGCDDAKACAAAASCPYARLFEPRQEWSGKAGPSGMADWPRPFVFRAASLDGRSFAPGREFEFDLVLFEHPGESLAYFVLTFLELARTGLGPGRGRAELVSAAGALSGTPVFAGGRFAPVDPEPARIRLDGEDGVSRVRLRFVTPTELKAGGELVARPEFGVLLRRLRDRVANLRQCYQGSPLDADFAELGRAADGVRLIECDLRAESVERLSSRTGQRHPLGGFTGECVYEGEIGPFTGYLRAGQWTGAGRQTVWGKGCFEIVREL